MANTIKIRRRAAGGAAGAPASLASGELAYNEVDDKLYYGFGDTGGGVASSVIVIGGLGQIVALAGNQTIAGVKTFSSSPLVPTPSANDNSTKAATTEYVDDAIAGIGGLSNNAVTNAHLTDMAVGTVKGRRAGAGSTGDPTDITNAELKSDMAFVKGDVGLGNVDNTSDATKNAATATLTNKTLTTPVINSPTGLVKADVGLGNVDNTADTAKPVSTAQQTALDLKANLASPALTGNPTATTQSAGDNSTRLATTAFVKTATDNAQAGLSAKQSVRVASTAQRALTGLAAIDGVTPIAGDRVLLKNQTAPAENGIWVAAAGAWSRSTDADADAELEAGAYVFVEEGSTQADTGWVLSTDGTVVIGTTAQTWAQFTGAGQITAGAGLTKTGNTLDAVGVADRITVGTDSIDIASTYVGQTSITTLGTIGTGTWQGTVIGGAYGGLGVNLTSAIADGALLKRSGTVVDDAVAGTDYLSPSSAIDGGTF